MLASLTKVTLSAILALGFLAEVKAADTTTDPSGTWTWTMQGRAGGPDRIITMKIKVSGDKVTGTVSSPGRNGQSNDTEVQDGKLKDGEISFSTTREANGNKITNKYTGKVTADSIKGRMDFERNGEAMHRDWEAKRATGTK